MLQLKELEEEWGKISGPPPPPTRRLRSQQAAAAAPVAVAAAFGGGGGGDTGGGGVVEAVPEVIDPYDLADPEDFLGKMPKDFFDKIVSTCLY